jgi:hypothetical protein
MTRMTWFTPALAVVAGCSLAAAALAQQSPPPSSPPQPAAKAAKPAAKAAARKPGATDFKLVLEPRAMDILKAASAKLAAAKSMSFTAVVGYEYPSKLGPPLLYTTRYDVTMQRPDKLRILVPGDGPATEFYYDGKSVVAYAPAANLAAIADAPPTIEATLERAYRNAAIYFPFEDLLAVDPYAALTNGAILAFYIGQSSSVGGVTTDMVAWASNEAFLQMWIGAEDKLPRRIRAMFRADPLALQHEMDLSNWQLDPLVTADTFVSTKAQSAGRMAFAAPAPPPRGVKPLGMGKATPAKPPAKSN